MIDAPNFNPPYWDAAAPPPRFKMGAKVRVARGAPPGHVRTPWYVRGKVGVVERICGHFANPEELAYRRGGLPKQPLYRVRFALTDLFPGSDGYADHDTLDVEIFEHWLTPFFDYSGDFQAEAARVEREISDAP